MPYMVRHIGIASSEDHEIPNAASILRRSLVSGG